MEWQLQPLENFGRPLEMVLRNKGGHFEKLSSNVLVCNIYQNPNVVCTFEPELMKIGRTQLELFKFYKWTHKNNTMYLVFRAE